MTAPHPFAALPTTILADLLDPEQVMDHGIGPVWGPAPRLAGPAVVAQCAPNDHLMAHAAIYRAAPGSVIVAAGGGHDLAIIGGNAAAIAAERGIAGFVIDGVVRDVAELRTTELPVFARGLVPKAARRAEVVRPPSTIVVGGVTVHPGDIIVGDEDGVVVIPAADAGDLLQRATDRAAHEAARGLADWERAHRAGITAALEAAGDHDGLPD